MKKALLLLVAILVAGCDGGSDARYDSGYNDGYAAGWNTTLNIRSTLVEGDWDNKHYKRGYDAGWADAVANIKAGKTE